MSVMPEAEAPAAAHVLAAPIDPSLPIGIWPPQHPGDVGWDLVAAATVAIGPMRSVDVPVNLRLQLPEGVYVDVRSRSSMNRRNLYVDHGLIDNGYRGPMFVFIRNMNLPAMRAVPDDQLKLAATNGLYVPGATDQPYDGPNVMQAPAEIDPGTVVIQAGERIAQLVFHRIVDARVAAVPTVEENTARGSNGFGSTGA